MLGHLRKRVACWTPEHYLAALSGWLVALGALQVCVLVFSVAKAAIGQGTAIGILIFSAAAGCGQLLWVRSNLKDGAAGPAGQAVDHPGKGPSGRAWALVAALLAVGVYAVLWWAACSRVDWTWDGNAYHIPVIGLWARRGYVHWVDGGFVFGELMNGYPKAVEVVGLVLVRTFGTSAVINTTTLVFMPLGVLGLAYMSRLLGAPSEVALAAGTALVLVPVNIYQATSTYVDTSYACCVAALVAALLAASGRLGRLTAPPWSAAVTLGVAGGLAIGAKGVGPVPAGIGAVALAGVAARRIAAGPAGGRRKSATAVAGFLLACGLVALAVGGYWYVRNWRHEGSPLYPVGLAVGGRTLLPGKSVAEAISERDNTPDFMRSWPAPRKVAYTWAQGGRGWPKTIFGYDARLGGLGFLWLFGCVPAMALLLIRWALTRRRPAAAATVLVTTVTAAFLLTPMNWWARYTVWIYALGLPCLAVVAGAILSPGRARFPLRVWLSACVLVGFYEAGLCLEEMPSQRNLGAFRTVRPVGACGREVRVWYPLAGLTGTMLDEMVTGDSAVAVGDLLGRKALVLGPLSMPAGRRDVLPVPDGPGEQQVEQLVERGVRYVLWDDRTPVPPALRRRAVRSQHAAGIWMFDLQSHKEARKHHKVAPE